MDKDIFENQRLQLIEHLKKIQHLQNSIEKCKLEKTDEFTEMVLGIIEVIDTYEKAEEAITERNLDKDNNSKFVINRFKSVNKRLFKLLQKLGISKLEFPDNRLLVGFCKVLDTEPDSDLPNDSIIEVVRNGYIHGKELIREAEVIIVKN